MSNIEVVSTQDKKWKLLSSNIKTMFRSYAPLCMCAIIGHEEATVLQHIHFMCDRAYTFYTKYPNLDTTVDVATAIQAHEDADKRTLGGNMTAVNKLAPYKFYIDGSFVCMVCTNEYISHRTYVAIRKISRIKKMLQEMGLIQLETSKGKKVGVSQIVFSVDRYFDFVWCCIAHKFYKEKGWLTFKKEFSGLISSFSYVPVNKKEKVCVFDNKSHEGVLSKCEKDFFQNTLKIRKKYGDNTTYTERVHVGKKAGRRSSADIKKRLIF